MGNSESNANESQLYNEKDYILQEQLNDQRYGEIKVLKHNQTGFQMYDKKMQQSTVRKQLTHDSLVKLMNFSGEKIEMFCSTFWQITLLYEYLSNDLQKNILERKKLQVGYTEGQLWYILKSCVSALLYLKRKGIIHGDIRPFTILLSQAGFIKLSENFSFNKPMTGYQQLFQNIRQDIYISPLLYESLKNNDRSPQADFSKNDLFCLGLSILEAATFESVQVCYKEKSEFDQGVLQNLLQQVKKNYSEQFFQFLSLILTIEEDDRPDLDYIQQELEILSQNPQFMTQLPDRIQSIQVPDTLVQSVNGNEEEQLKQNEQQQIKPSLKSAAEIQFQNNQNSLEKEVLNYQNSSPKQEVSIENSKLQQQTQQLVFEQSNSKDEQSKPYSSNQKLPTTSQLYSQQKENQQIYNQEINPALSQTYFNLQSQYPQYLSSHYSQSGYKEVFPQAQSQSSLQQYQQSLSYSTQIANPIITSRQNDNKAFDDLDARIDAVLAMSRETVNKYGGGGDTNRVQDFTRISQYNENPIQSKNLLQKSFQNKYSSLDITNYVLNEPKNNIYPSNYSIPKNQIPYDIYKLQQTAGDSLHPFNESYQVKTSETSTLPLNQQTQKFTENQENNLIIQQKSQYLFQQEQQSQQQQQSQEIQYQHLQQNDNSNIKSYNQTQQQFQEELQQKQQDYQQYQSPNQQQQQQQKMYQSPQQQNIQYDNDLYDQDLDEQIKKSLERSKLVEQMIQSTRKAIEKNHEQ